MLWLSPFINEEPEVWKSNSWLKLVGKPGHKIVFTATSVPFIFLLCMTISYTSLFLFAIYSDYGKITSHALS